MVLLQIAYSRCVYFLNMRMRVGWINRMFWFVLTHFPSLFLIQKTIICKCNWTINIIDIKWPCCRNFHYCYPYSWSATDLCRSLTLRLSRMRVVRYFCSSSGAFWNCLSLNGYSLLVFLVQEGVMVVSGHGWYLITHCEFHPDILHILSLIKYAFEYLCGTCWLFVIANILPLYLHPLLMVVVVKLSGGGGLVQNIPLCRIFSDEQDMILIRWEEGEKISLVCFCVKMNTSLLKI